jgi:hypothetical protein
MLMQQGALLGVHYGKTAELGSINNKSILTGNKIHQIWCGFSLNQI